MEEEEDDNYHFEEGDRIDELEVSYSYTNTTFLKVLCILTWVYTLVCTFLFLTYYGNSNNMKIFYDGFGNNSMTLMTFNFLILPIVCSIGAIFMFMRNKWGFVIYLFGQAPPIIYKIYLLIGSTMHPAALIPLLFWNAFPIGFLIMYGTQLRVMKPLFNQKQTTKI